MRIPVPVVILAAVVIIFLLISPFRLLILTHDIMGAIIGFIVGCAYMRIRSSRQNTNR